jgi:hypothetical protein
MREVLHIVMGRFTREWLFNHTVILVIVFVAPAASEINV